MGLSGEEVTGDLRGAPCKSFAQPFLLVFVALLVALEARRWLLLRRRARSSRGPPGPFPWPILGNALQLGSAPHLAMCRMARRYGDVFMMKLGGRPVLVLNGATAIRQALVKQGADFAGRPAFPSFSVVSDGHSMAFGGYSPLWKMHKRVAQSTLRHFSSSGNAEARADLERYVVSEAGALLDIMLERSGGGRYFNPSRLFILAIANVMSALCFGRRYDYDNSEFREIVSRNDKFGRTVGAGSLVDVMPWLLYFPNPVRTVYRDFVALNMEFNAFTRRKVEQHRADFKAGSVPRDFTDSLIAAVEVERPRSDSGEALLSGQHVSGAVNDIFGASQDTLSTALLWLLMFLVRFPSVQRRVQEEVDRVAGRHRLPRLDDRASLPYTEAFVFETLRYSSFVPVTIPHSTTTDTEIAGYRVPKDTVVFVNQWSSNHDPERWRDPETFEPTRFLDESGTRVDKDLASNVLIFSVGKRRCIGDEMSKMQLLLFAAILAHQCSFEADPAQTLTMDSSYGLTLKPMPFEVCARVRDHVLAECFADARRQS
ncbi:unnamed protein product [Lampetra fluviatilis]